MRHGTSSFPNVCGQHLSKVREMITAMLKNGVGHSGGDFNIENESERPLGTDSQRGHM